MRDGGIRAALAVMVSARCAIGRLFASENFFSDRISWMHFLRRCERRGASTGLVQQTVQIVALHDPGLVVGRLGQVWLVSACNFNPSAPMTLRMVSKLGLRSPESAL